MDLIVLESKYAIFKFRVESDLPDWIYLSDFYSVTKTKDELSVVTMQPEFIPEESVCSQDWRIIKIVGPLDLSMVGVIADISHILKGSGISIFTISTYDTDYILVKEKNLKSAIGALEDKLYKCRY